MEINYRVAEQYVTINLVGKEDNGAEALGKTIDDVMKMHFNGAETKKKGIIFDLNKLCTVSSSLISKMMIARKRFDEMGKGSKTYINLHEKTNSIIFNLLYDIGLYRIIPLYQNQEFYTREHCRAKTA